MIVQRSKQDVLFQRDDLTPALVDALPVHELLMLVATHVQHTFLHEMFREKALFYPQLDALLHTLSQKTYAGMAEYAPQNDLQLIIGSQFSAVGGHSRVAHSFTHIARDNLVIATDPFNDQTDEIRQDMLDFFHPVPVLFIPHGNLEFKLNYLVALIQRLKPTYVSCFNHHVDPIPIAATSAAPVPRKIFYHHCDYLPSLGASLGHYRHLDTTSALVEICSQHGDGSQASVLNLYDHNLAEIDTVPPRDPQRPLNTVSAGGSAKYLFTVEASQQSYAHVIPHLIAASGGLHHHYGHLGPEQLQLIKLLLQHSGIDPARFVYHGNAKSLQQAILTIENPVYVPSFPVHGGLTVIEMMSASVPILLNGAPRGDDAEDFMVKSHLAVLPPQHVAWRDASQLPACLAELRANYDAYAHASRHQYVTRHTRQVLLENLAALRVAR